jgi:hypothetical protein
MIILFYPLSICSSVSITFIFLVSNSPTRLGLWTLSLVRICRCVFRRRVFRRCVSLSLCFYRFVFILLSLSFVSLASLASCLCLFVFVFVSRLYLVYVMSLSLCFYLIVFVFCVLGFPCFVSLSFCLCLCVSPVSCLCYVTSLPCLNMML